MMSLRDDLKKSVEFSTFSFVLIGFTQLLDKVEFGALVLAAPVASPGGKLSSEARLMRSGEMYRL